MFKTFVFQQTSFEPKIGLDSWPRAFSLTSFQKIHNAYNQLQKQQNISLENKALNPVVQQLLFWTISKCAEEKKYKKLCEFTEHQWQEIGELLKLKELNFLWQLIMKQLNIIPQKSKNGGSANRQSIEQFLSQEDELLKQIVTKMHQKISWSNVAKQMFQFSKQKFNKKPKQYRQRWKNYLDPSINRNAWTPTEDIQMLGYVISIGKMWSRIGTFMNRTQNSIKNRFKSLAVKHFPKSQTRKKSFFMDKNIQNIAIKLKQDLSNQQIQFHAQQKLSLRRSNKKIEKVHFEIPDQNIDSIEQTKQKTVKQYNKNSLKHQQYDQVMYLHNQHQIQIHQPISILTTTITANNNATTLNPNYNLLGNNDQKAIENRGGLLRGDSLWSKRSFDSVNPISKFIISPTPGSNSIQFEFLPIYSDFIRQ